MRSAPPHFVTIRLVVAQSLQTSAPCQSVVVFASVPNSALTCIYCIQEADCVVRTPAIRQQQLSLVYHSLAYIT